MRRESAAHANAKSALPEVHWETAVGVANSNPFDDHRCAPPDKYWSEDVPANPRHWHHLQPVVNQCGRGLTGPRILHGFMTAPALCIAKNEPAHLRFRVGVSLLGSAD